jgi:hypothetical protein
MSSGATAAKPLGWARALPWSGALVVACGPEPIVDATPPCPEPIVGLALGIDETCLVTESGRLRCFGNLHWLGAWLDSDDPLWAVPWVEYPSPIVDVVNLNGLFDRPCIVSADGGYACAHHSNGFPDALEYVDAPVITATVGELLLADGRLLQLAGTDATEAVLPGAVATLGPGVYHTCATTRAGEVACRGLNTWFEGDSELTGQLGVPGVELSVDYLVLPLTGARGVTVGDHHTCAWFESGEYACWGANHVGALGNGQIGDPIGDDETLDDLPRQSLDGAVVQMVANYSATCARLDDGGVRCWGDGAFVQLLEFNYQLDTTYAVPDPMAEPRIPLPEPAVDIDLGESHACAVGESGAVYCWGRFPSQFRETNNFAGFDNGGYLDPSTDMVRPLVLEDPEVCAAR